MISTLKTVCYSASKTSDYTFIRDIGRGGYGCVVEVKRTTMDMQAYALKIVKLLDRYRVLFIPVIHHCNLCNTTRP